MHVWKASVVSTEEEIEKEFDDIRPKPSIPRRKPFKVDESDGKITAKHWMIFIGFLALLAAITVPDLIQAGGLSANRKGIDCIIQQLAEHRINNRSSHQADALAHNYQYNVPEPLVPRRIEEIDIDICNQWLSEESVNSSSTTGRAGD